MFELTRNGIQQAKDDGCDRACFGRGLWLDMRGAQPRWLFRYTSPVTGREREFGLGTESDFTSLATVKSAHDRLVGEVAAGICPTDRRKR